MFNCELDRGWQCLEINIANSLCNDNWCNLQHFPVHWAHTQIYIYSFHIWSNPCLLDVSFSAFYWWRGFKCRSWPRTFPDCSKTWPTIIPPYLRLCHGFFRVFTRTPCVVWVRAHGRGGYSITPSASGWKSKASEFDAHSLNHCMILHKSGIYIIAWESLLSLVSYLVGTNLIMFIFLVRFDGYWLVASGICLL